MKTRVFHTVNNGFYLEYGDTGVFFDGIHKGHDYGFSDTPEEVIDRCYALEEPFDKLRALFFTHKHEDHFDPHSVESIVKRNKLTLYAPKYAKSNAAENFLYEGVSELNVGEIQIFAVKTIHDGKAELRREPHVSFVVNTPEETFFIAGDARFKKEEKDTFGLLMRCSCTAVFANPYQLMSEKNIDVLKGFESENVILAHMPFEQDDMYNLKALKKAALETGGAAFGEIIVPEHNAWVEM